MRNKLLGTGDAGYHPLRKLRTALSGLRYAVLYDWSVTYKLIASVVVLTIAFGARAFEVERQLGADLESVRDERGGARSGDNSRGARGRDPRGARNESARDATGSDVDSGSCAGSGGSRPT